MLKRSEIQDKIDDLKKIYPDATLDFLKEQLNGWLDTFELGLDNLTHDFIKGRILEDIQNYEGVN